MLERRLAEIKTEKVEIRTQLENGTEVNLDEIKSKLEALETEERNIQEKLTIAGKITDTKITKIIEKEGNKKMEERKFEDMNKEEIFATPEYRSAFFRKLQGAKLSEVETRAMTVGTGGNADAAVPTTTLDNIINKLVQTSVLFPLIKKSFIPGNLTVIVQNAINSADWHTQATPATAKDAGVVKVNLGGFELIRLVQVSKAALAMTVSAFESYIVDEISKRLSVALENAIINGTGATTNDQPTGIIPTITATPTITKTGMTYKDVLAIVAGLPTLYHQNAVMVMNRALFFGDVAAVEDNYGRPIFTLDPTEAFKYKVLGYPVVIDDYAPTDTIVFGDLSYYQMNFSQGVQIEKSLESSFGANLIDYKGTAIVDGKVLLNEAFVVVNRKTA